MKKQRRENGAAAISHCPTAFPDIASLLPVAREFLTRNARATISLQRERIIPCHFIESIHESASAAIYERSTGKPQIFRAMRTLV